MSIMGLELPYLSEADPDTFAEGSLEPLGTDGIADRLAEELAPHVRARMQRIRLLTAIAVASVVCEPLEDVVPADGVSPPYLVFEWHLIEAIARQRKLAPEAALGVPGTHKARAVLARGGHLDSGAYLKTAKVFGFHGVYKPLARGMRIVDDDLLLLQRGDELLRLWEREQSLAGFTDSARGSEGARLRRRLEDAVRSALLAGRVTASSGSHFWSKLAQSLGPDGAGGQERARLWMWLVEPAFEIRRELALLLHKQGSVNSESEALRALRPRASTALKERIDAVDAYERLVALLQAGFDTLRYLSTSRGAVVVALADTLSHPVIAAVSDQISSAYEQAELLLAPLGLELRLQEEFGSFAGLTGIEELGDALLSHHDAVQSQKGKRPWFERDERGFIVRPPYRVGEEPEVETGYLHQYRVFPLQRFVDDIG